ncbi:MAG: T9SS type A sorting domain-containing protein [Flavobacteriaceae bacterium]
MKKNRLLLFAFLAFFTTAIFAQKKQKLNYKLEAKKETANYFTIVEKKKQEIASYDLKDLNDLKEYKHFNRWKEYWRIRVNADGSFPSENLAYFNAGILTADGKLNANFNQNAKSSLSQESWTNVGAQDVPNTNGYSNFPQMGRLNCFLRIKHPSDRTQDVLFVGAPNGGIWKSTDGGANWSAKLDMVAGIGVTDIKTTSDATFANYTTKPIYVSTGDWDASHAKSIGVLKSTDGGETYSSTGLSYSLSDNKLTGELIVIDANTVFVGTATGISKTTDGGANWAQIFNAQAGNANMGRAAITGTKIMYTGLWDAAYTDDYTDNSNWSLVNGSGSQDKKAITVGEDNLFYLQTSAGQIQTYNGTSYSNVGTVPAEYNSQGGYNQALIVKNDMLISGEFNGAHSSDNGANWYRSLNGYWNNSSSDGNYIHSDHHGLGKLDGAYEFWSVNDGGLNYINYTSATDQKPTIEYKSAKTIVTQHYSVAINPSANDGAYLTGNQDNDGFSKINGTWYAIALGDGIESAINYNNSNIRYATNQNAGSLLRSDNGFNGELQGDYNISLSNVPFVHTMEMDRTNPSVLYINSSNGIIKVTDNGSALSSSLIDTESAHKFNTHGGLVMAVSNNNVIRSIPTNGSAATSLNGAQSLPNSAEIESIDFNASTTSTIYVSTKGYNNGNKVFKSINGGTSFTNITNNLPDVIINKILLKQGATAETLFVATNVGVYFTINGGTNWAKLGQGLPNVDVKDIEIHYTADKLVAATFGRGLWDINIEATTLGINETELNNGIALSIYPNPINNGNLNIKLSNQLNDISYEIYNVVGGIVKKGTLNKTKQININGMAKNIYLIRLFNNNFSSTRKFVIN